MKMDVNQISDLSTTGVYTLLLFLSKKVTVEIGMLGKQRFPMGYCSYTGSAFGKGSSNLKHRIARHLRREKRKFWHIDYLLANENVSVEAVVAAKTNENIECNLNHYMKNIMGAEVPVRGFGASDCRKNCASHLLYFPKIENVDWWVQKLVKHLQSSSGTLSIFVVD